MGPIANLGTYARTNIRMPEALPKRGACKRKRYPVLYPRTEHSSIRRASATFLDRLRPSTEQQASGACAEQFAL